MILLYHKSDPYTYPTKKKDRGPCTSHHHNRHLNSEVLVLSREDIFFVYQVINCVYLYGSTSFLISSCQILKYGVTNFVFVLFGDKRYPVRSMAGSFQIQRPAEHDRSISFIRYRRSQKHYLGGIQLELKLELNYLCQVWRLQGL